MLSMQVCDLEVLFVNWNIAENKYILDGEKLAWTTNFFKFKY